MNIFISGASGLIGGNCLKYFKLQNENVLGTYFSFPTDDTVYFDTLNPDNILNTDLGSFAPNVIVHCGALTHVDYCETHEEESYLKTVQSTLNLIALADRYQCKIVYISTDYVFDGKHGPYTENDDVNPISVYARHKLQAEQMVLSHSDRNLVLRVTNVYGDELRNKNFVSRIIEQCRQKKAFEMVLPFDQYATPVNAYDVARAMYVLLRDKCSGIFHIASTDYMNRVELAFRVLNYFPGANYTLRSIATLEMKQPAPRPLNGGLLKTKFSNLYPDFLFENVDDFVRRKV